MALGQRRLVNGVITWAVTVIALLGIALVGGGALVGSLADTATQFVNLRAAGAGVDITEATRTAQQTAGVTAVGLGLSMLTADWAARSAPSCGPASPPRRPQPLTASSADRRQHGPVPKSRHRYRAACLTCTGLRAAPVPGRGLHGPAGVDPPRAPTSRFHIEVPKAELRRSAPGPADSSRQRVRVLHGAGS